MTVPSVAISGPHAEIRLHDLGLTVADIHEAIDAGYSAAASCTDNDPRSLPGVLAWGKGTGSLRDCLASRGWTPDRTVNYERVVHPSNSHAIALASATSQAGIDGPPPRTRTPKGRATSHAVRQNAQLTLGLGTSVFAGTGAQTTTDADRETWLLLHYYDANSEEIRVEISLPLEMEGKHITAWRERILLPAVSFSADIAIVDEAIDIDDVIDIDVTRRAD